eukprot:SAG31_NODE_248_length_19104_cov_3.721019_6_plen_166_part_00
MATDCGWAPGGEGPKKSASNEKFLGEELPQLVGVSGRIGIVAVRFSLLFVYLSNARKLQNSFTRLGFAAAAVKNQQQCWSSAQAYWIATPHLVVESSSALASSHLHTDLLFLPTFTARSDTTGGFSVHFRYLESDEGLRLSRKELRSVVIRAPALLNLRYKTVGN